MRNRGAYGVRGEPINRKGERAENIRTLGLMYGAPPASKPMSDDLEATLKEIINRLRKLGVEYMLVGSVAALAYGRSRAIQHFDLVVALDVTTARAFVRDLPADRFYASEDAAADAVINSTFFNVIDMATGWKVDLVPLKNRAFSLREFQRRQEMEVLGMRVFVASVEDVILSKLEWSALAGGSARQLDDIRELVGIAEGQLDLPTSRPAQLSSGSRLNGQPSRIRENDKYIAFARGVPIAN